VGILVGLLAGCLVVILWLGIGLWIASRDIREVSARWAAARRQADRDCAGLNVTIAELRAELAGARVESAALKAKVELMAGGSAAVRRLTRAAMAKIASGMETLGALSVEPEEAHG
jgi:cell division protein FtsB